MTTYLPEPGASLLSSFATGALPTLEPTGQEYYVVHVHHRHGDDYWLCTDRLGADRQLYQYVTDWWETELGSTPIPTDPTEAIAVYMERTQEWGAISAVPLLRTQLPPFPREHEEVPHAAL